jgi:hypothetical protein
MMFRQESKRATREMPPITRPAASAIAVVEEV